MDLIVNNKLIKAPILNIINQLKSELPNKKLKDIKDKYTYISVTCPHHKGGLENKPSCSIYCGDDPNLQYGYTNCFSCDYKGPLYHFIGECFDEDDEFGKEWLLNRFGNTIVKDINYISPIIKQKNTNKILDENILDSYQNYHPYMTQRKLTKEIILKFKIKYDPVTKNIIFPVWDEHNKLIMLTKRNIDTKQFYIDKNIDKPVYLLNYIQNNNIKEVYVCESQINTLTCFTYNKPAIGMLGTGSQHQYELLKKSGIKHYILGFDGDFAGDKGIFNFILNLSSNALIDVLELPRGKDINDLSKEEFDELNIINSYEWLEKHKNFKLNNV